MNRLYIERILKIKVGFSWVDWELYDMPGVVLVAQALNGKLELMVNSGGDRMDVLHGVCELMKTYRKFGAYDTEPVRHLDNILDEVFGEL